MPRRGRLIIRRNAIKEFTDNPEGTDKSLGAFLQEIALLTDADNNKDADPDVVQMMTIHAAKGLEFKVVFVVGMEEDLFPSQMMLNSRADLEEERRLFYVAITRAQHRLYLSYSLSRYRYGRLKSCEPSRFLEELNPDCIKINKKMGSREAASLGSNTSSAGSSHYAKTLIDGLKKQPVNRTASAAQVHRPSANFTASDPVQLKEGMRVEHQKFGYGKVEALDLNGTNRKAKIQFDISGEKTLLLSFAKLRIVED